MVPDLRAQGRSCPGNQWNWRCQLTPIRSLWRWRLDSRRLAWLGRGLWRFRDDWWGCRTLDRRRMYRYWSRRCRPTIRWSPNRRVPCRSLGYLRGALRLALARLCCRGWRACWGQARRRALPMTGPRRLAPRKLSILASASWWSSRVFVLCSDERGKVREVPIEARALRFFGHRRRGRVL
jgi:hypothetical protein